MATLFASLTSPSRRTPRPPVASPFPTWRPALPNVAAPRRPRVRAPPWPGAAPTPLLAPNSLEFPPKLPRALPRAVKIAALLQKAPNCAGRARELSATPPLPPNKAAAAQRAWTPCPPPENPLRTPPSSGRPRGRPGGLRGPQAGELLWGGKCPEQAVLPLQRCAPLTQVPDLLPQRLHLLPHRQQQVGLHQVLRGEVSGPTQSTPRPGPKSYIQISQPPVLASYDPMPPFQDPNLTSNSHSPPSASLPGPKAPTSRSYSSHWDPEPPPPFQDRHPPPGSHHGPLNLVVDGGDAAPGAGMEGEQGQCQTDRWTLPLPDLGHLG